MAKHTKEQAEKLITQVREAMSPNKNMTDTEKIILETLKHHSEVEEGWWFGYDYIQDDILDGMDLIISIPEIKVCLKSLRKQGFVETRAILNPETGLLMGRGYFYKIPVLGD